MWQGLVQVLSVRDSLAGARASLMIRGLNDQRWSLYAIMMMHELPSRARWNLLHFTAQLLERSPPSQQEVGIPCRRPATHAASLLHLFWPTARCAGPVLLQCDCAAVSWPRAVHTRPSLVTDQRQRADLAIWGDLCLVAT